MRKFLTIATVAAVALLSACDVIDEGDRLIPVADDEFQFGNKVVLMEEFTGHRCMNCPTGAERATELVSWSNHHVIPVSIHCGVYSMVGGVYSNDFTTEAGDAYFEEFAPEMFPTCAMDRGTLNSNIDTWQSDLIACALNESPVEIEIEPAYNASSREATVNVTVTALQDVPTTDLSVQIWLVESGIVGAQLMPDGHTINREYVHNHVLRGAVNGTWGESIGSLADGEVKEVTGSMALDEAWVPDNCAIVAFVFDTATKRGVLQAAEKNLMN